MAPYTKRMRLLQKATWHSRAKSPLSNYESCSLQAEDNKAASMLLCYVPIDETAAKSCTWHSSGNAEGCDAGASWGEAGLAPSRSLLRFCRDDQRVLVPKRPVPAPAVHEGEAEESRPYPPDAGAVVWKALAPAGGQIDRENVK